MRKRERRKMSNVPEGNQDSLWWVISGGLFTFRVSDGNDRLTKMLNSGRQMKPGSLLQREVGNDRSPWPEFSRGGTSATEPRR